MNAQQLRREVFIQAKDHEMIWQCATMPKPPLVSVVVIAHRMRSVRTDFHGAISGFNIV